MRVGYACNEDDLQWAGLSCSDQEPCPVYLELTAVESQGTKILAGGNLHSTSATLSSILLRSDDSGATWKQPTAGIRGSAIDQLQLYDSGHGFAAGETQYPLPRDPFFLLTTDGGASWHKHLVGEDGDPGSIQRFWFDSPMHGEVVVETGKASTQSRYLSYESDTGGETWQLRGSSGRVPALKRAPAPADDTGWRIGDAKDGNAWQIEKRQGDQWTSVASFASKRPGAHRTRAG